MISSISRVDQFALRHRDRLSTVERKRVLHAAEVLPGDQFILCSDGLHGYLKEGEVELLLGEPTVEGSARRAIELANDRGGRDNITAVIVNIA